MKWVTRIQKRVCLTLGLAGALFSFADCARAADSVQLGWNPSSDPTVAGYLVSYGAVSGIYTNTTDVGTNLTARLSGMAPGQTYYFVVAAYNALRVSSAPTPEVAFTVLAQGSGNSVVLGVPSISSNGIAIQFSVTASNTYHLQTSADLISWAEFSTISSGTTNGVVELVDAVDKTVSARFYRLVLQ